MDVGGPQLSPDEHGQRLVDGGEEVQARDDGGGVDEGVLEVGVAGEELRLEEARVGNVAEQGDVHAVRGRHVLEGYGLEEGHGCVEAGQAWGCCRWWIGG